jgi:acyl-coenzyme A synthetase/AMP-(fatty) acid ligase
VKIPNPSGPPSLLEKSSVKLDDFRQPEVPKYVRFVSDYPQTPSGKVMKFELRAAMIAALGLDAGGRWPS